MKQMKSYPTIVNAIHDHLENESTVNHVCKATYRNTAGREVYRFYLDTACTSRTLYNIRKRVNDEFGNNAGTMNFNWAYSPPSVERGIAMHSYKGRFSGPAFDLYI